MAVVGRPTARARAGLVVALGLAAAIGATPPVAAGEDGGRLRAQIRLTHHDGGTPHDLFDVDFPDERTGYAVGKSGTVLVTSDGGATWAASQQSERTDQESGEVETLTGVSFPDADHGWAVGLLGSILTTADGGASWQPVEPPPKVVIDGVKVNWAFGDVSFTDPRTGYLISGPGTVVATADGGASWSTFTEPRFGNLRAVTAIDATHGQAVGWSGPATEGIPFVTVATADGGRTWEPRAGDFGDDVSSLNFNAVAFVDPLRGYAVGDEGRIVATSDGGATWTMQRGGGPETLTGVDFADARRGVAVGTVTFTDGSQKGLVYATEDGGQTWTTRILDDVAKLWGGVDFAGPATAYAVGCRTQGSPCTEAAVVQVGFLEPVAAEPEGGSGSPLALVLVGVAVVLTLAGALATIRLRRSAR